MLYYRKKESNKKHYIKLIVIIAIIIISSLLPVANKVSSNIVLTVLRPVNSVTSFVVNEAQTVLDNVFGTKPNRDMVKKLQAENNKLKDEMNKMQIIINDSNHLKEEFTLKKETQYKQAKVIGLGSDTNFNNFIIDQGETSGIKKGDVIVSAFVSNDVNSKGALVGKVQEVYKNTSMVSSIMDAKFNLTFMHKNTNGFGVINARFGGLLEGYTLDKDIAIKKGDIVLTSGIGGVYQEGILIGNVVEVTQSPDELTKLVKIKSPVNFNRIYDVFVIPNEGEIDE